MQNEKTSFSAVLGVVLSNLRKSKGVEQGDMAARMGLSQPSYSRLESGKSAFSVDQMFQAAKALGTTFEELNTRLIHNIEELQANGIEVVQPVRGNTSKAQKQGNEMGQLVAGAALGALLFSLLTK
ncbi:XRE family transcriptional regulator [Marinobacter halodurans]|uniref:XRE family transcriptional regulator n=1 Tax=Marinobacter halodurans TaxID=2528979 RepID=A0ABY1ZEI7_9GAMM|nr:helix-turn-helix transcriptional regulator [Marinobacter halodurans]TBW48513.1 XRE family transcriptional regulator [Marinobacter halodurans]